jgi:flagella basal body P-ring formation protein FlgA
LLIAAALSAAPMGAASLWAAAWQDVAQLELLAKAEAARHIAPLTDRQRFLVGPVPPNLQLEPCDQGIRASIGPGSHMQDRLLIELRCSGPTAWHLFVPIRVIGTSPVLVAAHALVTGSVLGPQDLVIDHRDMSQLPPGFLDDISAVVGLTVNRPIPGGCILTNQQLVVSKAVQRGQTVTLIANGGGLNVRMPGRALSDGLINQRIRVENLSSGKVVEGIARSPQVVEIIFN